MEPSDTDRTDPLSQTLLLAQRGDEESRSLTGTAIIPLVEKCARRACRRVGLGANPAAMDDVSSDTLVLIYRGDLRPFDPLRGSPEKYVLGHALNAAKRQRPLAEEAAMGLSASGGPNAPAALNVVPCDQARSRERDPSEQLIDRENAKMRSAAIEEFLASTGRLEYAIRRHYFEGIPVSVLARDYGVAHTTLARQIQRELAKGRAVLAPYYAAG